MGYGKGEQIMAINEKDIKIADVIETLKMFLMKFNKLKEKEAEEFLLDMSLEEILEIYTDLMKSIIGKGIE